MLCYKWTQDSNSSTSAQVHGATHFAVLSFHRLDLFLTGSDHACFHYPTCSKSALELKKINFVRERNPHERTGLDAGNLGKEHST